MRHLFVLLLTVSLFSAEADHAPKLDRITLASGGVLVGAIAEDGNGYVVRFNGGQMRLLRDAVKSIERGVEDSPVTKEKKPDRPAKAQTEITDGRWFIPDGKASDAVPSWAQGEWKRGTDTWVIASTSMSWGGQPPVTVSAVAGRDWCGLSLHADAGGSRPPMFVLQKGELNMLMGEAESDATTGKDYVGTWTVMRSTAPERDAEKIAKEKELARRETIKDAFLLEHGIPLIPARDPVSVVTEIPVKFRGKLLSGSGPRLVVAGEITAQTVIYEDKNKTGELINSATQHKDGSISWKIDGRRWNAAEAECFLRLDKGGNLVISTLLSTHESEPFVSIYNLAK